VCLRPATVKSRLLSLERALAVLASSSDRSALRRVIRGVEVPKTTDANATASKILTGWCHSGSTSWPRQNRDGMQALERIPLTSATVCNRSARTTWLSQKQLRGYPHRHSTVAAEWRVVVCIFRSRNQAPHASGGSIPGDALAAPPPIPGPLSAPAGERPIHRRPLWLSYRY
jgi:hypothetical protein